MPCPICRLDISDMSIEQLYNAPEPIGSVQDNGSIEITPELQILQNKMKKMFIKQLNLGGIIDKEAEEKRFLIVTSSNEHENQATSNYSSLTTRDHNTQPCMSSKNQTPDSTDASYVPKNSEKNTLNYRYKERRNRSHKTQRSDKTNSGNNSDNVASSNINTSISKGACDIVENESDKKPTYKENSYRGGRNKGRRYKPRPS